MSDVRKRDLRLILLGPAGELMGALRRTLTNLSNTLSEIHPLEIPEQEFRGHAIVPRRLLPEFERLGDLVGRLDIILADRPLPIEVPHLAAREFWSLGTAELRDQARLVDVGSLQPIRNFSLFQPTSQNVIAFLIAIDGDRDLLKREHHDRFGWHYHYLSFKEERSNLVLCFDRYAAPSSEKPRPLFSEKHGEGRYKFKARPELWGKSKRESMYRACSPDLARWPLNSFKHASKEAKPVWPLDARLTPNPDKN